MTASIQATISVCAPRGLTRGWVVEVSAITGSVLAHPLSELTDDVSDSHLEGVRRRFLCWLLTGDDGRGGAQNVLPEGLQRKLLVLISEIAASEDPLMSRLADYSSVLHPAIESLQSKAGCLSAELSSPGWSFAQARIKLLALANDFGHLSALEAAEGVASSICAWEHGHFMSCGHFLAEAILAYTSAQAFRAATIFWSGDAGSCPIARIYEKAYRSALPAGDENPTAASLLAAHQTALDVVRQAARQEAAEKITSLL